MVWRFGEYEIDDVNGELRRRGERIPIEPKVFEVIALLARHPGRVIARDVIMRALWRDVTVGASSLTRLVKEARRAVGDDVAGQRVIRTHRGRGYAFVAPIERVDGAEAPTDRLELVRAARLALLKSIDRGAADLRSHVDEFVRTCQIALEHEEPRSEP